MTCIHVPNGCSPSCASAANGATCNDGDACTINDVCVSGQCIGKPKCNDNISCTVDTCNNGTCTYTKKNSLCDGDGLACSDTECEPTIGTLLAIKIRLFLTGCVTKTRKCTNVFTQTCGCLVPMCAEPAGCNLMPDKSRCNNNNPCLVPNCSLSDCCTYTNFTCPPPAFSCLSPICDPLKGCNPPNDTACDDGIACTIDICSPTTGCLHISNDTACDDGIACTIDMCSLTNGCLHFTNDTSCDDGIACTEDTCSLTAGCQYSICECAYQPIIKNSEFGDCEVNATNGTECTPICASGYTGNLSAICVNSEWIIDSIGTCTEISTALSTMYIGIIGGAAGLVVLIIAIVVLGKLCPKQQREEEL